jgi:aspartate aminotransferase/aminotransferase
MTNESDPLKSAPAAAPMRFAKAADEIPEAMSIQFNQMVYDLKRAGRDVIVLSLGEAFFHIPLFDFHQTDYVKGYHYSDSMGLPELRQKIAAYYLSEYGAQVDPDTIMISAGSKIIIYLAMLVTLERGEEVLMHDPCWVSYPQQARLVGAVPKNIPYDAQPRDFEKYMTDKTRMLVLNNPNNPGGFVYSAQDLRRLYDVCRARGIYMLVDEAYSDFVLDGSFSTMAKLFPSLEHVIIVNSLSKNLGMSGWRIGYAITHKEVIKRLLKTNQHLITCAPTTLQQYCVKYFEQILSHTLPQVAETVRKRRRVAKMLDELELTRLPGGSTFYFFVGIDPYPGTSFEFATTLLQEKGVCVVPGSGYGTSTDRFVRVGIGTESEERIREALVFIKDLTQSGQ